MKQYLTKEEAAKDLSISGREIAKVIAGIKDNMGPGKRYGQYSLRGSGRILQVRYAVLTDYMRYRECLEDETSEKYIPQFDIRSAERDLGVINNDFQRTEIDVDAIAAAVVKAFALKMAQ